MMKKIKNIGTTSFIISDFRVKNLDYLRDKVDIVQLLYLDSEDGETETKELLKVKQDIEYIAHMPIDIDLSLDNDWTKLEKFISDLKVLDPKSYIIHPKNHHNFFNNLVSFKEKYKNICVENIDEIESFSKILHIDANICLDAGHALLKGIDIKNFINKFGKNITTYHLHGVFEGVDHLSMKYFDKKVLKYLLDFASEKEIDIIIEVFGLEDFTASIDFLRGFFRENDYDYHRWS